MHNLESLPGRESPGAEPGRPHIKALAAEPRRVAIAGTRGRPGCAVLTAGAPVLTRLCRLHREALHQAAAPDPGPQVLPPPPEDAGAAGQSRAPGPQLPVDCGPVLAGHALRALPGERRLGRRAGPSHSNGPGMASPDQAPAPAALH